MYSKNGMEMKVVTLICDLRHACRCYGRYEMAHEVYPTDENQNSSRKRQKGKIKIFLLKIVGKLNRLWSMDRDDHVTM